MEAISNWFVFLLVNSAWQIAAITLVSLVCDLLLSGMQARFHHALWVTALTLCFGLPLASSFALTTFTNPAPEAIPSVAQIATDTKPPETIGAANLIGQSNEWVIPINESVSSAMFILYALLIGYRAFKLVRAIWRMRVIRRCSVEGGWSESDARSIEDCRSRFGLENIEILRSAKVSSPITFGVIRPVIVLPEVILGEKDRNILISAVSHELNHVRRRDYLKNLLYELIYLPISFHPAATLVKRRIRDTRELVCDEYVAEKMVEPATYARSLVSIAGMAMDLGRTANITIGILDDDALEKRIMKILNRRKITALRRNLLLGSATLIFAMAIATAMSFSFTPVVAQQKDTPDSETERLRKVAEELRRDPSPQAEEALKKAKAELQLRESEGTGSSIGAGVSRSEREEEELAAKREAELKVLTISRADLAKRANITMTQAINIATSQEPGTVMETRIVFERNGGETEQPFYIVTIVVEKDGLKSEKRVVVSGIDGSVGGPHNN